ncbi:hypothetical protein [Adhaeribacter rhizoryzae]|uniref:hypothetical protein n=1 Tax=Adhaeribacter rhizoryzae TaxID=2607907 RepID=UPI00167FE2EC|nr:hypothetical protein [Adhaeribacter rhizoryzae]
MMATIKKDVKDKGLYENIISDFISAQRMKDKKDKEVVNEKLKALTKGKTLVLSNLSK